MAATLMLLDGMPDRRSLFSDICRSMRCGGSGPFGAGEDRRRAEQLFLFAQKRGRPSQGGLSVAFQEVRRRNGRRN
jgi:hypothetical protein